MSKVADKKCQYVVKLGVPILLEMSDALQTQKGYIFYMLSLLIKKAHTFFMMSSFNGF